MDDAPLKSGLWLPDGALNMRFGNVSRAKHPTMPAANGCRKRFTCYAVFQTRLHLGKSISDNQRQGRSSMKSS